MFNKKFVLFISLFVSTFILSGCFGFSFGEDGVTIPLGEDGESVTFSQEEEEGFSVSGQNKDGEEFSFDANIGSLPDDFPDYITFPDQIEITSSLRVQENETDGVQVTFLSTEYTSDGIIDFYKNLANDIGYEIIHEIKSGEFGQLHFTNDNETIGIMVVEEEDDEGSGVFVTISVFQNEG